MKVSWRSKIPHVEFWFHVWCVFYTGSPNINHSSDNNWNFHWTLYFFWSLNFVNRGYAIFQLNYTCTALRIPLLFWNASMEYQLDCQAGEQFPSTMLPGVLLKMTVARQIFNINLVNLIDTIFCLFRVCFSSIVWHLIPKRNQASVLEVTCAISALCFIIKWLGNFIWSSISSKQLWVRLVNQNLSWIWSKLHQIIFFIACSVKSLLVTVMNCRKM